MIRSLRLARRSAVKARTQAANQLNALLVTAPDGLRAQLRSLPLAELVATAARLRPDQVPATPTDAAKFALRSVAGRWLRLTEEITELDVQLERLVATAAPALVAVKGWAPRRRLRCWSRPGTTPSGCTARARSRTCVGSRRSLPHPARPPAIV
jgi:transposase